MSSDRDSSEGLTEGLEKQSYEIKDELQIRKVLEAQTDWQFEFTKNDKFAYDLKIRQWSDEPQSNEDRDVIGYVELERSRADKDKSWITGDVPGGWYYLSFLQRKVRKFDYQTRRWCGLKDGYDRTVYLKFNHALDNCFAAPIPAIHRDGERTKRSDGTPENTYLALDQDHNEVRVGPAECVEFIEQYLSRKEPSQTDLTAWGEQR